MTPGQAGVIKRRHILGLCPEAPLALQFQRGEKKLIPMVHVHGLMMNSCEHTGVPMQMASHGYLVVVPDQMDNTCPWTTNAKDEDIWFNADVLKDPKSPTYLEDLNRWCNTKFAQRKADMHAVGAEIKQGDFL